MSGNVGIMLRSALGKFTGIQLVSRRHLGIVIRLHSEVDSLAEKTSFSNRQN